jgi:hypothetical protein
MYRKLKILAFGLIAIVICYVIYFFYEIIRYSHSSDWQTYKQYVWLIKDSLKNEVDTNFSYSYVKRRDVYNMIHLKGYNIIIWEFRDLDKTKLKKININQNVNLDGIKFSSGEVLNKKSDLEITIKYGFEFNYGMNVNLDEYSKLEKSIERESFKGFYGSINKMSLSDERGILKWFWIIRMEYLQQYFCCTGVIKVFI